MAVPPKRLRDLVETAESGGPVDIPPEMIVSVKEGGAPEFWQPPAEGGDTSEKIWGVDDRIDISHFRKFLELTDAVAHITVSNGSMGTGFLIEEDILITNNHVFTSTQNVQATVHDAVGAFATFNFEQDANGKVQATRRYACLPHVLFRASLALDYAIVQLEGRPGETYGTIPLTNAVAPPIRISDDVFIIQHPQGGPKQIAMAGNQVEYVDSRVIQYTTDTLPGSSGAPVFGPNLQLCALHHSGGDLVEPTTGISHFRNEGIQIAAIYADLSAPAENEVNTGDVTSVTELMAEETPLDALERGDSYETIRRELKQALMTAAGFVAFYSNWSEAQLERFHEELGRAPMKALMESGLPPQLARLLIFLSRPPQAVVASPVLNEGSSGAEILPAAYWGVNALIRTPAGQRLVAQAAQRWAPSVLRWGKTGIDQAWKGILTLNP